MKSFLGFLPLDVGVSILSALFIMLGSIMFCLNVWSYFSKLISYLLFICLFILIMTTWVIAFIGCNKSSLNFTRIAAKLWYLFTLLWIGLTIWSLFFTNDEARNAINNTKQLYNEEDRINDEFVERPNVLPLMFLVVDVKRSPWEVIAVPLILLMIFVFANFVLGGYISELKGNRRPALIPK